MVLRSVLRSLPNLDSTVCISEFHDHIMWGYTELLTNDSIIRAITNLRSCPGNSTSAVLDGVAVLTMLPRGEDYTMTIPYAHCKGILMGTLSMELGGKININCEKTGYQTELEFKLKVLAGKSTTKIVFQISCYNSNISQPFLGGAEQMNQVVGRIRLGKETLATISGYWDGQILITDKRTGVKVFSELLRFDDQIYPLTGVISTIIFLFRRMRASSSTQHQRFARID